MDERRLLEIIRQRSRIFDLETGGREAEEHPLIEGGVLDLRTSKLRRTVFTPGLRENQQWRPLSPEELGQHLSPWAQEKFKGDWAHFYQEEQQAPSRWFRRHITGPVSKGDWVWAHNARFDLRFMAQNLSPEHYDELVGSPVGQLLSRASKSERRLHVTGGFETYHTYSQARHDPQRTTKYFVQSWGHFKDTLGRAAENPRQGLFLDTQYIMQSALAHAQEYGYMRRRQDVFTGTSLEAYRTAFQRDFEGAAHTVAPDVRATAGIMEDYLGIIHNIRRRISLTPEQHKALRFHEELQPRLFPENVRTQLLEAKGNLLQNKPFEFYTDQGVRHESWMLQDLFNTYENRKATFGYEANLGEIFNQVNSLNLSQVEEMLLTKDDRVKNVMSRAWQAAQQPAAREFEFSGWKQFARRFTNRLQAKPMQTIALGVGGVMAALALKPAPKKEQDTQVNLEKGWFNKQHLDPAAYAGLVQHLNKNKINHYRMNGY